jgi:hypothetical protein
MTNQEKDRHVVAAAVEAEAEAEAEAELIVTTNLKDYPKSALTPFRVEAKSVSAEGDEDLGINLPDRRIYIQVKKRAESLTYSDREDTPKRLAEIRAEHGAGHRKPAAYFWVVCNSEAGPELLRTKG